tara:strand:+ start:269 stop:1141 length:873 start_codon:yes stop_codon:yes gene_type:complete
MEFSTDISNKIKNLKIDWKADPFPHAIVDNFLSPEVFSRITNSLNDLKNLKDIKKKFSTYIESNKEVYGDKDLNKILKLPINILGGIEIKKKFENFFNIDHISSLTDEPDYGGYYPFHIMKKDGILGSHVDHSHSSKNKLHVANSIYYVSPKWEASWGGETLLLNSSGTKILKKILPSPNRLILFIHSAKSFHAVNKISCPDNVRRNTYYIDYYTNDKNLNIVYNNVKNLTYSFHSTTFIPFFPLGLKSFKIEYFFKRSTYKYLLILLKYIFNRLFLNYKTSKYLKKNFY